MISAYQPSIRKLQEIEVNLDNMPPVCGKKKKKFSNTSLFYWNKVDSRKFCTDCLQHFPVGFFWRVRMEAAVLGLGKENSLPEFGKGNVMPM